MTETERSSPDIEDARRYRRLRILGCAPAYTGHLDRNEVMRFTNLDEFVDADMKNVHERGDAARSSAATEDAVAGDAKALAQKVTDAWDAEPPPFSRADVAVRVILAALRSDEAATPPDLAHDLEAFALVHEKNGTTGDTAAMLRQAAFEIRRLRSLAQPKLDRAHIAAALAEKWPGDYAFGDPPEGANEMALETADVMIAALTIPSTDRAPQCARAGGSCGCTSVDECPRAFAQANQE